MKNLVLVASVLISTQTFAGGGSSIGPANPAAINCLKLGGTLESVSTSDGQNSNCVIDEWLLFREMYARGLVKEHGYGSVGMPNPAAVNCIDAGGELRIVESPEGQAGYCVVEQWTLFHVINVTTEP